MEKLLLPAVIKDNKINLKLRTDYEDIHDKISFELFYFFTRIFPETKLPYTEESEKHMDEILERIITE